MKKVLFQASLPFKLLYKTYCIVVFFLLSIVFFPIIYIIFKTKNNPSDLVFKIKKIWAKILLILFLIKLKIYNKKTLPKDKPIIICSNHQSYIDILVLVAAIDNTFLFLGKSELLNYPIIGIFFKYMDIPINRDDKNKAIETLELIKSRISKDKSSIIIFPEGKIPDDDRPFMTTFKNGAFKVALETKASILPITMPVNYKIFTYLSDIGGYGFPGIVKVYFHDLINVELDDNIKKLNNKTFEVINSKIPKIKDKNLYN